MRRALTLSLGDVSVFFTRPVSAALLLVMAVYWLLPALKMALDPADAHTRPLTSCAG